MENQCGIGVVSNSKMKLSAPLFLHEAWQFLYFSHICQDLFPPWNMEFSVFFWQSFYIFSFNYFNWRLTTLQYCSWFCHALTWISHGCACVPHPATPFHLSPYPILQGHPSAPALSTLSHASNLGRQSVSHMIIYMFQCYFLKLLHPRLLPQIPKTLLYIYVYFAASHIRSSLPSF